MTVQPVQFPYFDIDPAAGNATARPFIPVTLTRLDKTVRLDDLLDTGATFNVLPYNVGLELGAVWEQQTVPLQLSGNLADLEARGLVANVVVADFPPVELVFAWTKSNAIRPLLGQMNFFMEFDVCFFRARRLIEIRPKQLNSVPPTP